MNLTLRAMTLDDLALLERWLHEPHFAQWFLQDSTIESELADNQAMITGEDPASALIVELGGSPVGWCQWYRWEWSPQWAAAYGAVQGEVGIDYGIGDPACIGRGVGTALIGALVRHVRTTEPGASVLTGPSAANTASRRVLEKNGFVLVDVRDIADEPNASPIALYRLSPKDFRST